MDLFDLNGKVAIITGSTRGEPERLLQNAKALFLYKPFSRSELLNAISRIFSEQSDGGRSA